MHEILAMGRQNMGKLQIIDKKIRSNKIQRPYHGANATRILTQPTVSYLALYKTENLDVISNLDKPSSSLLHKENVGTITYERAQPRTCIQIPIYRKAAPIDIKSPCVLNQAPPSP